MTAFLCRGAYGDFKSCAGRSYYPKEPDAAIRGGFPAAYLRTDEAIPPVRKKNSRFSGHICIVFNLALSRMLEYCLKAGIP